MNANFNTTYIYYKRHAIPFVSIQFDLPFAQYVKENEVSYFKF